jgi:hypothetical protein
MTPPYPRGYRLDFEQLPPPTGPPRSVPPSQPPRNHDKWVYLAAAVVGLLAGAVLFAGLREAKEVATSAESVVQRPQATTTAEPATTTTEAPEPVTAAVQGSEATLDDATMLEIERMSMALAWDDALSNTSVSTNCYLLTSNPDMAIDAVMQGFYATSNEYRMTTEQIEALYWAELDEYVETHCQ